MFEEKLSNVKVGWIPYDKEFLERKINDKIMGQIPLTFDYIQFLRFISSKGVCIINNGKTVCTDIDIDFLSEILKYEKIFMIRKVNESIPYDSIYFVPAHCQCKIREMTIFSGDEEDLVVYGEFIEI